MLTLEVSFLLQCMESGSVIAPDHVSNGYKRCFPCSYSQLVSVKSLQQFS